MSQNAPLCKLCDQPCTPRPDRPGKFRHLCEEHWGEYKRQKSRESYARHKEKRVQEIRDYRKAHPEYRKRHLRPEVKAYMRAYQPVWNAAHPEKRLEYERRYIEKNRERVNAKVKRRSHRKRTAVGSYTETQWQARLALWGWRCYLCGAPWEHMDHVIPVALGGSNWPANLRPICASCNSRKGSKRLADLTA